MASQVQKSSGKGPSFLVCELGLSTSTHYLENRMIPSGQNNFQMMRVEQVQFLTYVGVRERLIVQCTTYVTVHVWQVLASSICKYTLRIRRPHHGSLS